MSKFYSSHYYHCTVCEQFLTEQEIVTVQNTRSSRKAWRECPMCGSKVLPVADKDFDGQEMLEDIFHKALS
jgi:DNA-directed RNA polymerase subunit RPC12/RpoP